jgi:hypothetical protein
MSFGPFPGQPGARPFTKENVVKWEINYRFGIIEGLWWRFVPGTEFEVLWPTGWTEPEPAPGGGFIQFESSDPNDHYRPWLEKHVGRQGWDWQWRLGKIATTTGDRDTIRIKIRRGRSKYATIAALRWA